MSTFTYTALDATGRTRKGVLEGDTPRQVRDLLRARGLAPLSVDAVRRKGGEGGQGSTLQVRGPDLVLAIHQWSTLLRSGMTVEEALRVVGEQAHAKKLHTILLTVRARVMEGESLADSLAGFPRVFPPLIQATVAAGEQSGRLDEVLERLADFMEERQAMGQRLGLAMLYPMLVSGVALLVVIFLMAYVVPQIVQMFADFRQQLPWLTRVLIGVSGFLQGHGVHLLGFFGLAGFVSVIAWQRQGVRLRVHRGMLALPVVSRLIRGLNAARFSRTLSVLLNSGVPVVEGLSLVAGVVTNLPMREAVDEAARRVREGTPLHQALAVSDLYPPMVLQLIANGEAGGNLGPMLERAAEGQEREVGALSALLLGLFEPLMILVMGGLVLVIVIAILLPIFELNRLIQ